MNGVYRGGCDSMMAPPATNRSRASGCRMAAEFELGGAILGDGTVGGMWVA
ncbi:MAG: hypothetical protein KAR25_02470 [Methanosarcinales archaeon]|nr:hypothetical protein [Methanosarcinales archaeon]